MKVLYITLFISVASSFPTDDLDDVQPEDIVFPENSESAGKDQIVNGEIVKINTVPYLVQIIEDDRQICGGSIISPEWVVTAAHCFEFEGNEYSVLSGSSKRGKGGQLHEVTKIILHEHYDENTYANDIALMKLKTPIKFGKDQKPIKIAKSTPSPGEEIKVAGFGALETDGPSSADLRAAVLTVTNWRECKVRYAYFSTNIEEDDITRKMFCAGLGDSDSCQGDSGGPAVSDDKLVGIVSYGLDCGSDVAPGVYTRIVLFRKWIKAHTGLEV